MSRERTDALVAKLAADLEPVKPIAPIWQGVVGLFLVAAFVAVGVIASQGPTPTLWAHFLRDLTYAAVLVGLVAAVAGSWTGALASVVPGRELLLRLGAGIAVGGLLLGLCVAGWLTPWGSAQLEPASSLLACIGRAAGFALLPALAALGLTARGWSGRPEVTVGLAVLGAGAAGALLVHLTCPTVEPLHALFAHVSPPILITLLVTGAVAPSMGRWAR